MIKLHYQRNGLYYFVKGRNIFDIFAICVNAAKCFHNKIIYRLDYHEIEGAKEWACIQIRYNKHILFFCNNGFSLSHHLTQHKSVIL